MDSTVSEGRTPVVGAARTKNFNLRAYFAGGGAAVALIAAGVVVFGSLGAYVAFNGLPVGPTTDRGTASVAVEASAQADIGAHHRASARSGQAGAPFDRADSGDGGASSARDENRDGRQVATTAVSGDGAPVAAGSTTGADPAPTSGQGAAVSASGPTASAPSPSSSQPAPDPAPASEQSTGPVGNVVQGVEDTVQGAGVDVPISSGLDGVTAPVDQTVQGLGDTVTQTTQGVDGVLNDLTD